LHGTAVLGIETTATGARVRTQSRTQNQTLDCDFLLVAAGAWLPSLLPELHFPVSVERRVLAWFTPDAPQPLADGRMPIFCLDADGGWYGMPTLEGQVKLGHDKHLRQSIDPDAATLLPNAEDAAFLARCPERYLARFQASPAAMKACIYTLSTDHHFLMDWAADRLLAFSCCSGHGFKYAPVYGQIAADLLSGREAPALFRIQRAAIVANRFA
jgi:sarcosine oxidase